MSIIKTRVSMPKTGGITGQGNNVFKAPAPRATVKSGMPVTGGITGQGNKVFKAPAPRDPSKGTGVASGRPTPKVPTSPGVGTKATQRVPVIPATHGVGTKATQGVSTKARVSNPSAMKTARAGAGAKRK